MYLVEYEKDLPFEIRETNCGVGLFTARSFKLG